MPEPVSRLSAARRLLGCGAHGVVRVGRVLATGERVAVKVSPIARSAKSSLKELTVLTMLPTHTHLVRIYSAQVNVVDGMLYLVLELCAGGELFDRIAEAGGMPEPEARRCFMQILSAIVHCHSAGVYHRDLKPENILLDVHDNVKVADFGLASTRDREASSAAHLQHTAVGSLSYAAPELHNGADGGETGYDPEKADIWSLGVVLYCMLTARLPFQLAHALLDERYAAVVREGIQLMCPESLSAEAVSLLGLLLHPNPTARPSARELMDHAWLEGVERPEAAPDTACVADAPSPVSSPLPAPPKWSEYATRVQLPDGSSQPRLQTNPAQQQRSLKRGGCASSAELDGAAAHSAERARGLQPSDTWELLGQACTAGAGESGKRLRTSADPAAAGGTVADATQRRAASGGDQQVGVPDLVRHLGWERLDGSAVELMANVLKALGEFGLRRLLLPPLRPAASFSAPLAVCSFRPCGCRCAPGSVPRRRARACSASALRGLD